MKIREALASAQLCGVARLDAQLLLAHLLDHSRAWLLAHDDLVLGPADAARMQAFLQRRAGGEPLHYITGVCDFRGLALQVTPDTLVPRPETEVLVDWALQCLVGMQQPGVVDLGTGSGAIALALQHARRDAQVCATDASAAALAVARRNAALHAPALELLHGDWWAPLAGRRFALALSNPPYVAGGDPHLAALGHEPRTALTPEGDGLSALRHIVRGAPQHLLPGAWLLLEHGHDQAGAVQQMLREAGFVAPETRHDLAGLPRCTGAAWHAAT